jgi:hypothetical protein
VLEVEVHATMKTDAVAYFTGAEIAIDGGMSAGILGPTS